MCVAAATLGLVAQGASVGLTALSAVSQYQQGKAQEQQAELNATNESRRQVLLNSERIREDRRREGQEIVNIGQSGVSGAFGSPFLVAVENAETSALNRLNAERAGQQGVQNIRTQGANAAAAGTNALFNGLGSAAVQGFNAASQFKQNQQNALYLGRPRIPGVR